MDMKSGDGPESSRRGSPFIPERIEEFLKAYGVNRLDDPVPVAADAAREWIRDYRSRALTSSPDATVKCLIMLLEGKPEEFLPCEDCDAEASDEDMEQRPASSQRHSVPLKTAVELFAAAQHLGVMPRLWPGLLVYLQPMLTELAMEEAAWMAANMLAVAPPAQYHAALAALFSPSAICVSSGLDSEQSRLSHACEPMLGVLGTVIWRMCMSVFAGKVLHWAALVPAVASNPHIPAPVATGLFATACLLCTGEESVADAGGKSLGPTLDCFLAHLLHRGAPMASVCALFADAARQFTLGEHEGAADAVLPRLRVLGDVAGSATAATASDARSRASGEDAGGSQDGDSGSLDMGRQADAVERALRYERVARELGKAARGDCFVLRWGLHTCPAFRIAVARLQIPPSDGEAASAAAANVAMAVSCVEPRLGGCGDAAAADCSLGVTVRYACESEGAAAMLFAQAAAEAARSTPAQWSRGGAEGGLCGGPEVFLHAVGVLPTPRSSSQASRLADALCAVQEAWEGDWGVRETPHDWYALASDGVPVPMIHRVVEGGGMEMQPGSTAGVNNLWGVAGFAQEAFCWGSKGSGLLGKEVFVYACLEMQ